MEVAARAAGVDDSRAGRRDGRPGPPRAQRAEAGRVGSGRGGGAGDALTRSSVLSRFLRRNSVTHWLKQRSTSRLYIRRLSRVCIPSTMSTIRCWSAGAIPSMLAGSIARPGPAPRPGPSGRAPRPSGPPAAGLGCQGWHFSAEKCGNAPPHTQVVCGGKAARGPRGLRWGRRSLALLLSTSFGARPPRSPRARRGRQGANRSETTRAKAPSRAGGLARA